ncbi:MAG: hypothetical protein LBC74_04450 [Planctomycetaceae bacterium]|jgi:phosphopantetheinyl transferase (holo-ACP synthase)|nr:hypothetical protein [Planctomycetaceae bacterium]
MGNNSLEIGNDTIKLFNNVPVIRFESDSFFGVLCEVDLIVSGIHLSDFGLREFLCEKEQSFLQTIRATNFKHSWLAGRLLAKSAWLKFNYNRIFNNNHSKKSQTTPALNQFCIVSRDQFNHSIAPVMFFDGEVVNISFSISHIDSHVAVFFAKENCLRVGCDLVNPDSITTNLQKLFYDQIELDSILNSDEKVSFQFHNERIWSVKETAFKILGNGKTFKPRQWLTRYITNGWYQCTDADSPDQKKINIRTLIINNKILAIGNELKSSQLNTHFLR